MPTRRPPRESLARTGACGAALAVTVGVAVFWGGGFGGASQSAFVALSGSALLLTAVLDGDAALAALRSPPAWLLGALGLLCVASAAWTIGAPSVSIRWGLTIVGYCAVFVTSAVFARATGPWPLAAGVAVLAAIEAIVALRALALHTLPDAEPIGGVWRPGGTFQYPPALAILQAGAVPILGCAIVRGRPARRRPARGVRRLTRAPTAGECAPALGAGTLVAATTTVLAGTGALLAGAVIGLAGSRLAIGLAVAFSAVFILMARSQSSKGAAPRSATIAAIVTIALVLAGASIGRAVFSQRPARTRSAQSVSPGTNSHEGGDASHLNESRSDPLHDRAHEWGAALRTWLDFPLVGAGGGAYYQASVPYQGSAAVLYAHDLPLELAAELGVLGLLLGVGLYAACVCIIARTRNSAALVLLGATVVAFLASNLVDWTWHLAGLGAVWAAAAGGLAGCGLRATRRA